ncbi:N-acetylornithine carbamoyltransferase [Balneola vulgaris]|uniref:N-acetylornithine carbamoyltransferase n=1 Tax=Balneola vulgaris TaxID=287535 RepID=UPI00036E9EF1|nr:N-acetylornithine carbamoyltransferase [Balneola vulgaris]
MNGFFSIDDVDDLPNLIKMAKDIKKNPYKQHKELQNKSICLLFLNPSLRTRLSSQRAAQNLGVHVTVFDVSAGGWQIEFEDGAVMNGNSAEHIKEAAAVIGTYFDIVAVRAFAQLQDRCLDYSEQVLNQFIKHCPVPVVNLESSTRHPLQAFADVLTIESHKKVEKPKVVLTWAPHPKALPQAVANSFSLWVQKSDYQLTIVQPKGYELAPEFVGNAKVEYDQLKAFECADFIYAKNWSSYSDYGKILTNDRNWMVDVAKMQRTNEAKFMHCLPVRRNVVVSDDVIDSANSLVVEEASNRIVSAQTIFKNILEQ